MVFSSLVFLCIFLPTVFVIYNLIPSLKIRNALLIVTSLIFYAYGEPVYVLLMIFSSFLNYLCALFVNDKKAGKFVLFLAVAVNLGILGVFKYSSFAVESFNSVTGLTIPVPEITLPIGISFFTFQALSYVIDVYRNDAKVQKNYFSVLLYISFFPQLIAGPIVKYKDIDEQISCRSQSLTKISEGLRRFVFGLGKKVLIANTMGQVADKVFALSDDYMSSPVAWLGALTYLFQIYYDFSGYSDMAIGLGKMFGFEFKENFNYPYGAISVQDFWRKWHISLSTWFKEYLYIPLGGNRKGKTRTVLNRLIVFFCTGLWHGANWTFVLWGMYHGLLLLFEEYVPFIKKMPTLVRRIYTVLAVTVGFVIFRADSIGGGFRVIADMFTGFDVSEKSLSFALTQLTPWFIFMFICAVIGCAPVKSLTERIREKGTLVIKNTSVFDTVSYVATFLLLAFCVLRLSGCAYNPFIYFRF